MAPHSQQTAPTASASLANRYGRPQRTSSQRTRRWGRWVAVVALIFAVGMTAWWSFSSTQDRLSWKDVGFTIESDTRASVTFQLTKEPEETVSCAIQILTETYAISGWDTVVIGPAEEGDPAATRPDRAQYYEVELRTDAEGVNGGVNDCWYSDRGPRNISYLNSES